MDNAPPKITKLSSEQRKLFHRLLQQKQVATEQKQMIARESSTDPQPLSFAQERLWFLDQLAPDSIFYHIPLALRFSGQLHIEILQDCLTRLVQRHEALRTTISVIEGRPVQMVAPVKQDMLPLDVIDLDHISEADRQAETLQRLIAEEVQRPFDLVQGPLLRAKLLRQSASEHLLLLTMHHIISDGWSLGILVHELTTLYAATVQGQHSALPPLPIHYADFARWQRQQLQGEPLAQQLTYWQQQLAGSSPLLELPTDHPRPAVQTFRGARQLFTLEPQFTAELKALSQREGVTLFMTLLTAFYVLLHVYTDQDDLIVGTPIANRTHADLQGLIGCFANTLVMRTDFSAQPTLRQALHRVREVALEAYAHQDVPFEQLVEAVRPERHLSFSPIFQVMFALQNAPLDIADLPDLHLQLLSIETGTAKFDLTLSLIEMENGLRGAFEYNIDLFEQTKIKSMPQYFHHILTVFPQYLDQPFYILPLLNETEKQQLLTISQDRQPLPACQPAILEMLKAQVRQTPDALAVSDGSKQLTYSELNAQADKLAWYLQQCGVGPEVLVGVCMERSLEMIVALLGVFKAGGAYVPLDPQYPQERLTFMLENADVKVLLTNNRESQEQGTEPDARSGSTFGASGRLVCLDQDWWQAIPMDTPKQLLKSTWGARLAYVIYTSGSTGRPKGVQISQDNLAHLVAWHQQAFALKPQERVSQIASLSFDAAGWEIWPALCSGACVVLVDDETRLQPHALRDWLLCEQIGIGFVPTPLAEELLTLDWPTESSLRLLLTGGDRLQRGMRAGLPFQLVNNYGPTEATVVSTSGEVEIEAQLEGGVGPSLGRPLSHTACYVLDRWGQLVPQGVIGELFIGGPGVTRGYLDNTESTAERFVPDPFSRERGARVYRTGDLVRWSMGGKLEFVGRVDEQVKIRGYRIELGEIETVLKKHEAIGEAVVVARELPSDHRFRERMLVAYLVPWNSSTTLLASELRHFLQARLPEYMLPATFVQLPKLPLTPNGKVDRRALPMPDIGASVHTTYEVQPRNPVEEVLTSIWCTLLHVPHIGIHDDFFAVGGHSLLVVQVLSRIRNIFDVELSVRHLFETPTIAELAQRITHANRDAEQSSPLVPVARENRLPLSYAQQRFWFLDQLEPESTEYSLPMALRLCGQLRLEALATSLNKLRERHEPLRTTFASTQGNVEQVIAPFQYAPLPLIDLRTLDKEERETEARRQALMEAKQPFHLARGPLLCCRVFQLDDEEYMLVLVMHHSIMDGWSMGIFIRELAVLYRASIEGIPNPLPPLPLQYADVAFWEQQWLQGEFLAHQLAYWQKHLSGAPAHLDLPTDHPRTVAQSNRAKRCSQSLPAELVKRLKQFSQQEHGTLFMTLLAAFQVLLMRYTQQEELVVGIPVANRTRAEVENLLGCFVNTLAVHTDLAGNPSFRDLFMRTREALLGAYSHQAAPFDLVVKAMQPERDLNYHPLFQVMFGLDEEDATLQFDFPGVTVHKEQALYQGIARFDLDVFVTLGASEEITIVWKYNADLFEEATILRMLGHYQQVLTRMVASPEQHILELPILTPEEHEQLIVHWNATKTPYPEDACLHHLFEMQATQTPDAVALVFEEQSLTYQALNDWATQFARYLARLGVGPEVPVGIALTRSCEQIVALLGILKAGGTYVPLDPSHPQERLALLLAETQTPFLIAQQAVLAKLPASSAQIICLEQIWPCLAQESATPTGAVLAPDNLAYIIYTSGSTGKPKGSMITHRSLVSYALDTARQFRLHPGDRMLQFASLSVDIIIEELFPAWSTGATAVLRREEMSLVCADFLAFLTRQQITVAELPSAYWHELVYDIAQAKLHWPSALRLLIIGGERVLPERFMQWWEQVGLRITLLNIYGQTETTINATVCEVTQEIYQAWLPKTLPIGSPGANIQVYILDQQLLPVPIGIPGELYIGGLGLARGYCQNPDMTALKFLPNPFSQTTGARMYRTGDKARYLPDGNLDFLGRVDQQVKIRGFRVEPGEIETVLGQHPGVREAVVTLREDNRGEKHLVAYYLPTAQASDPSELRQFVQQHVPEYMLPRAFVALDTFPLSPTGKIDQKRLPAPQESDTAEQASFVGARTPVEEILATLWADLLQTERVGRHDNFFLLGGHSLLATRVIARMRTLFGIEMPLRILFETPTIAELGMWIEQRLRQSQPEENIPLRPYTRDGALPLSFAQQRLWFLDQLEPGTPTYNLQEAIRLRGALDVAVLERSVNELVARHESLRTIFTLRDGNPVQVILPVLTLPLPIEHVRVLADDAREQEVQRLVSVEIRAAFDLAHGPLIRVKLLRLQETEHVFLLTMHHIVSDAWSRSICLSELATIYEAFLQEKPSPLPPLTIQYADFAQWQRQWLQGDVLRKQLAYWQQRLIGMPALLDLPLDHPRAAVQTYRGSWLEFAWPASLTHAVKDFSRQEGVTLYMVLLAAFQLLLSRYSRQEDIVVGSPIANRTQVETEGLIGFFVNTLVLRTDFSAHPSFRQLLAQVRETALEAYMHQDLPFEQLVESLQPERNLSHTPLFQVAFTLDNASALSKTFAGLEMHPLTGEAGVAKFDLTLAMIESEQGLRGGLEYRADLFERATIAQMIEHLRLLLEQALAQPDLAVTDLSLLTEHEHQLLYAWNATHQPYPHEPCLSRLVELQVERTPNAQAIVFEQKSLTYRELNARANQLAHFLQAHGVGPEVLVGVCLERSLDLVIALLAILKAGGAYVPLDPDYPTERLAFMLTDSAVSLVLTQQDLGSRLTSTVNSIKIMSMESVWVQVDREATCNPATAVLGDHLAYMIYTSGSTGRPKGALNTQRGICNRLVWMQETYPLDASDRVLQKTPYSFDVSVWEFFWPLIAGATLVLARPAGHRDSFYLRDVINKERITTLHFVPSMLRVFLETENLEASCQSLRRVFCSGEALSFETQERFFTHCGAELHNLYGPTEAAVDVTFWHCQSGERVTLGRPIANTQIVLLDAHLHPVPPGVPGELCISSVGLARGYHQRPELTAQQFMPDPCSTEPGARIYRSGDLARYRMDGSIEYLGRLDHQVKLRGLRIELGEIEAVLREHPGIQEAVVLMRDSGAGSEDEKQLVAYLVPDQQRARPVKRLLQLEKKQQYATLPRCALPNGMLIFGQNKSEIDFLYQEIFEERAYLKHGIHLQPGDCVFDVGANIGLFSLFAAQTCSDLTIYAFEPLPAICTTLRANAELHALPIHIFECGLSHQQETVAFTYYPHVSILSGRFANGIQEREIVRSFLHNQQAFQEHYEEEQALTDEAFDELLTSRLVGEQVLCQVKPLSVVLRECGIERIDLLKVDVEKSEWDVLMGIEAEDWEKIKQIVIEVTAIDDRLQQIVTLLQQHGYIIAVEQDTSLQQSELYNIYAKRPIQSAVKAHIEDRKDPMVWHNPQRLIQDVRTHLKERVPDYMLPSAFLLLETLPVTVNGKLDQRALHTLAVQQMQTEIPLIAPQTRIERTLAEVWQELLHITKIGRDDNFFDLGGHSLLLIRLQNRLRTTLNQELAILDLFKYPTIKTLAAFIEHGQSEQASFSWQQHTGRAETRRETLKQRREFRQRQQKRK